MVWKPSKMAVGISAVCYLVGGAVLLKDYAGGKKYKENSKIEDKIVIVTGSNTGIGKETVWELSKRGARVIMACRNMEKCEEARRELVLDTKNKYIYCYHCDLASQKSIRRFAARFNKEFPSLHILINNAGVMFCPKSVTKEGIETHFGVNHLGHFLLTNLLLDKLKASAPSRILTLTSESYRKGEINFKDLNSDKEYNKSKAHKQSKLANILFTRELAKRLQGTRVTANAIYPGVASTEIMRHTSFYNNIFAAIFIKPLLYVFIKTPKQGAQTTIYAAVEESLKGVSGKYFSNCSETDVAPHAEDDAVAQRLWAISERWTQLS